MRQAGDKADDPSVLARVMACLAAQLKFQTIRAMLEGRRIKKVEFTNEIHTVGILLHLANKDEVVVSMAELSLSMLLRDPDIARQEQDLYYKTHTYRPMKRRRQKKGTNSDAKET